MYACEVALAACLVLLLLVSAAQAFARRTGQKEQAHVLGFFRVGLGLSACSYALILPGMPRGGLTLLFSFFFCFAGTLLIWRGWNEQRRLHRANVRLSHTPLPSEGEKELAAELEEAALPVSVRSANPTIFSPHAQQAIYHAHAEAERRHSLAVETDHLLLGLFHAPHCAGVTVLSRLGVSAAKLQSELGDTNLALLCSFSQPQTTQTTVIAQPPELTHRARQVLVMAAQEAHRFGKSEIGTEHLLLGLILIGTGPAATALFQAGVSVDSIRHEILQHQMKVH